MIRFYHPNDPAAPSVPSPPGRNYLGHRWHYVYLHGELEDINQAQAEANGWEWAAPDLFVADAPCPTEEGAFDVELYGRKAVAVLARTHLRDWLCGRVVAVPTGPDDVRAIRSWRHAHTTGDWR